MYMGKGASWVGVPGGRGVVSHPHPSSLSKFPHNHQPMHDILQYYITSCGTVTSGSLQTTLGRGCTVGWHLTLVTTWQVSTESEWEHGITSTDFWDTPLFFAHHFLQEEM